MTLTVSNPTDFQSSSAAKEGVTQAISNITGVPAAYIDVDLASNSRRLSQLRQLAVGALTATYVIAVPGDAPASVTPTGTEVGANLALATSGAAMEQVISTSVESQAQATGTSTFTISSVASLAHPQIEEAGIAGSSGTTTASNAGGFLAVTTSARVADNNTLNFGQIATTSSGAVTFSGTGSSGTTTTLSGASTSNVTVSSGTSTQAVVESGTRLERFSVYPIAFGMLTLWMVAS